MNCKYCGARAYSDYCWRHKPLKKRIERVGKAAKAWKIRRQRWIDEHPAPNGLWQCHYCGMYLNLEHLTLDHLIPRSNAHNYANRDDDSNLVPACWNCNSSKGSVHVDKYS